MASTKAEDLNQKLEKNLKMKEFSLKKFSEIEKGLYLAGSPDKHGELTMGERGFPKVQAYLGVNEKPPVFVDDKAASVGLKASLWLPIHDRPPFPGLDWLEMAVDFIEFAHAKMGWSTMVHCVAGLSRSAMCMTAYLMCRDGLTAEQAINKILLKRPIVINPSFIDGLFELEKSLKKR